MAGANADPPPIVTRAHRSLRRWMGHLCQHDVRVQAAKGVDVALAVPEKRCMDFVPIRGGEDGCSTSGQRLCSNWKLVGRQNSSKSFMVPRSTKMTITFKEV